MPALPFLALRNHFSRLASASRNMASIRSGRRERVTLIKRFPGRELADNSVPPLGKGGGLEPKGARPSEDRRRVILPGRRLDIDVELDLIAIRILDVEAMGDRVIRRTDEAGAGRLQLVSCLPQLGVGFSDLESEVIHPDPAALRDRRRVLPDLDQKQLVMRPPGREGRGRETDLFARDRDLLPAQHVAIETPRASEIANGEDQVTELLHMLRLDITTRAHTAPRSFHHPDT